MERSAVFGEFWLKWWFEHQYEQATPRLIRQLEAQLRAVLRELLAAEAVSVPLNFELKYDPVARTHSSAVFSVSDVAQNAAAVLCPSCTVGKPQLAHTPAISEWESIAC